MVQAQPPEPFVVLTFVCPGNHRWQTTVPVPRPGCPFCGAALTWALNTSHDVRQAG